MFSKVYNIGDVLIQVNTPIDYVSREPYSKFLCEAPDCDIKYNFVFADTLPALDAKHIFSDDNTRIVTDGEFVYRYISHFILESKSFFEYACIKEPIDCKGEYTVFILEKYGLNLFESLVFGVLCIDHSLAQKGAVILHSSYIVYKSQAILFTAPKQTGKSTQARLWEKYKGARIINGDRSLIRMKNNMPYAYGLPYAGTSKICLNEEHPLGAVVLLGQSQHNSVKKLSGVDAFKAIYKNIWLNTWCKYDVSAVTELTAAIANDLSVFRLDCLPDEEAVSILASAFDKL